MTIQTTGPNGLLYNLVQRALIENHQSDLVKFNIVNTEKLKQEFRDALKKDYDIKDIDESDILFCFEEVDQNEVEKPVDDKKEEDDGEVVKDTGSDEEESTEEEPNDDSEVSEEPDTKDDGETSENDTEGEDDSQEDDSEPTFGITGGDEDKEDNSDEEDDSQDSEEEDDDEDETVKAVKEAIMKEEEEEEQEDTEEKDQGDEIENATEKDKEDAQGTTMGSSKTKENVVKAVARALYIDNPDDIQMFDINYQNKRCFFIKANIRK